MMSIDAFIFGMISDNILQKKVQISMTAENPAQIPKLNGNAFRKPSRPALDMDIILFGPGVTAVTTA